LAGALVAGISGIGAIAFTGSATAEQARAGDGAVVIKIKAEGRDLFFDNVPRTIEQGTKLTIKNRTSPREVGPHTFSLRRPEDFKPFKRLGRAHKAFPPDFIPKRQSVDSGKRGWDRAFTKHHDGDSYFFLKRGETETRRVTAHVGKTLRFFCAVHPFMKGEFEVTD
jgi:hypothetical protein